MRHMDKIVLFFRQYVSISGKSVPMNFKLFERNSDFRKVESFDEKVFNSKESQVNLSTCYLVKPSSF